VPSYRDVFKNKHTFLCVLHVDYYQQAIEQVGVALTNGADGVFLINHRQDLLPVDLEKISDQYPGTWIGVNRLYTNLNRAFDLLPPRMGGVWTDNAHVHDTDAQKYVREGRIRSGFKGLYFGGVAFKYQPRQEFGPIDAVLATKRGVDVITTSGSGTGSAPPVEKIKAMREAIQDWPLAIASGITPDNVEQFMPYADCFLVATGISKDFHTLDPVKVKALAMKLGKEF
jgi:hypothetical protein